MDDLRENYLGNAPFKWIRAPKDEAARTRRIRAMAAFVFIAACFCVGLALGLVSTTLQTADRQHQSSSLKESVLNEPVSKPTDKVAQEPIKGQAAGPRQTASPQTLALTSDPALELKSVDTSAATAPNTSDPPVVLLNPGAADGGRKDERLPAQSLRVLAPENPTPQVSRNPAEIQTKQAPVHREDTAPGMAKDYRALRDYVLSR